MGAPARPVTGSGDVRTDALAAAILEAGCADDRGIPGPSARDGQEGAQAMAEKLVIELVREKETPGTIRFAEQDPDEDPKVGTLYVKKAASQRLGHPTRIRVTIETIEA